MIALVFCGDLKYCPYINRYIERLEIAKEDYKVFFWNRGKFNLNLSNHYVYYDEASKLNKRKIQKLLDFLRFRRWLLKNLKSGDYNKIIVLSTLSGIILGKQIYKYTPKYIFDIRDYSYEHIKPFYSIEKRIIKNSYFTAISSKGFKQFLPSHDYVIAHNFNRSDIIPNAMFKKTNGKINFVWNGVVRYFEFQKQYIDALGNDSRFQIVFHGDGPELDKYKEYCNLSEIKNVVFTGAYNNSDKSQLLKDANILNNCYGYTEGAGNKLKYAVSNRFYDGIIYHIPQLVEPEGYKRDWVDEAGVGVSIIPDDKFADRLYSYYETIEDSLFDKSCEHELNKILEEDDIFIKMIDRFILS